MKKYLDKTNVIFLILGLVQFTLTFFTDKYIFLMDEINIANYFFCKVILLFLIVLLWLFIIRLSKKDKVAIGYLKWFALYIIPILLLLALAWPGTWYGSDVNNFYNLSIKGEYLYGLSYLTSIFYIVGYMIFPCVSGAIIFQTFLFGIVFSYVMYNLYNIFKTKWTFLMIIPFALPHTIFYTFYANRPIIYGMFYLLLISILIFDFINKKEFNIKKSIIIFLTTGMISNWRSEAIYLCLAVPIFAFIVYKLKINVKNLLLTFGISLLFFSIVSMPQKIHNKKNNVEFFSRNMPMFINPLSYMLTQENFKISTEEYNNIDEVLDIESMIKYSSYIDTPCGWLGNCVKGYDSEEELNLFLKSYISVVKNNFGLFIDARFLTFKHASAINGDSFFSKNLYSSDEDTLFERADTKSIFGYQVRNKIYAFLEGSSSNYSLYNSLVHYSGSLIIPLIFIFIIFVYSIIKRKLLYFLMTGMLLGHTLIVFITAPAAYFMYYFNIYMCGWFFGLFLLIGFIKTRFKKEK